MSSTPGILFLDLDDTLLNARKEVTRENDEALREASAQGHRIVITTGRPLAATIPLARQLRLYAPGCCIVAFNGALIWDCGEEKAIFHDALARDDMLYLYREARKAGIHVQVYDMEHVLSDRDCHELRAYSKRIGIEAVVDPDLPESLTGDTTKVLFIDEHNFERLDAFRQSCQEWAGDRLSLFFSNSALLECVNAGISKGSAVRFMADYYGVPIERTVAAGDQENDIPMILAAGTGCAMKNAIPAVKEAADYVTENDCENSGVAEIIRKFLLDR
ncbi:MAG: HAD family phosphatase [Lachnospiraceae bacterium]|nr:HAD family phosphatase [Lachnospiraceae bacterium]